MLAGRFGFFADLKREYFRGENTMTERAFPPEFTALIEQYRDTAAGLGNDNPITRRLWLLVEHTAPDWFKIEMRRIANDCGLLPPSRQCDEHGRPVFSVEDAAAHLGMSIEEAHRAVERLQTERAAIGLQPHDAPASGPQIHPLH